MIPMPVIGGLILVIGGELIVGRIPDIRLVLRTGWLPAVAMLVTLLATTQLPLQQAILLGAGLSLVLYAINAERSARLQALTRNPDGRWRTTQVPDVLPSNAVTVLHYEGASMFAEVSRVRDAWPRTDEAQNAVVILHARTVPDIPSSTITKALERRSRDLAARGCRLMLAGVSPEQVELLSRTRAIDVLGEDNVVAQTPVFFEALDNAYETGLAWVAAHHTDGTQGD
jgi:SulP family sulfate permease